MCLYPGSVRVQKADGTRVTITTDCGRCIECSKKRSNIWATRIMCEVQEHAENCCLTLTYDDDHLPSGALLCKRDVQLFLKRLRKSLSPLRIRYFYSGEYGERRGRPHYHMIIFGWSPPLDDCQYMYSKNGVRYYFNKFVQDLWNNGIVSVDRNVTYDTAFYVAKYLQKYTQSDKSVPSFSNMSLRPPIGFGSALKNFDGNLYLRGQMVPPIKAFRNILVNRGIISKITAEQAGLKSLLFLRRKVAHSKFKPIEDVYAHIDDVERRFGNPFSLGTFNLKFLPKTLDKPFFGML